MEMAAGLAELWRAHPHEALPDIRTFGLTTASSPKGTLTLTRMQQQPLRAPCDDGSYIAVAPLRDVAAGISELSAVPSPLAVPERPGAETLRRTQG